MKTIFTSERILFIEFTDEFLNDFFIMMNDMENVGRYIGAQSDPYIMEEQKQFIQRSLEERSRIFLMIGKENREFIGNIELTNINADSAEIGIAITAEKQNKGYGKEAMMRATEYGFNELGLYSLYLKVYPENSRAINVYKQCGFMECGRSDERIFMSICQENIVGSSKLLKIMEERGSFFI